MVFGVKVKYNLFVDDLIKFKVDKVLLVGMILGDGEFF